jgi:RHS repeat-associated protein
LQNIVAPKNGYIFVYVSNESNLNVYFDNLQVIHKPGPILEETHYYPFGLMMAGISTKAATTLENKYKYNGKELQSKEFSDGSGLEWGDYGARMYDAQVGRFFGIDAMSDKYSCLTPFHYSANNPINAYDIDGNDFRLVIDNEKHTITIEATYYTVNKDNSDEESVMNNLINFWNSQSGKYQYTIGEGQNTVSYKINFNLTKEKYVTYNEDGTSNVGGPDDGAPANSIRVASESEFEKIRKDLRSEDAEGVAWASQIIVPKRRANDNDVANHEGGHSLGMTHESGDVMFPELEDVNEHTNKANVADVLGRTGYGTNKNNINSTSHVGTSYNNIIIGVLPKNFVSGKVSTIPKKNN